MNPAYPKVDTLCERDDKQRLTDAKGGQRLHIQ